VVKI